MVKPRKRKSETKKEFEERLAAWQASEDAADTAELEDHGEDNDDADVAEVLETTSDPDADAAPAEAVEGVTHSQEEWETARKQFARPKQS